jgi:cysteinyl-tRNA synthetase
MSEALLGFPFDIHTGGIDHREIHHPNEIAQNQARCHSADSGARIWMHNNFLIDRGGKMSKSKGEFLTLQALVDRGFHPLAYRLMCLQAHYRSELEFTFENLAAAFTRLKRMIMAAEKLPDAETAEVTDKRIVAELAAFDEAVSDDLNTAKALTHFETALTTKGFDAGQRRAALAQMDAVLGLKVLELSRAKLRLRPADTAMDEPAIETRLLERKEARAAKDFATSDRIRDELAAAGVEVMDGDPLGWDWKLAC